jgi:hypothetical protein
MRVWPLLLVPLCGCGDTPLRSAWEGLSRRLPAGGPIPAEAAEAEAAAAAEGGPALRLRVGGAHGAGRAGVRAGRQAPVARRRRHRRGHGRRAAWWPPPACARCWSPPASTARTRSQPPRTCSTARPRPAGWWTSCAPTASRRACASACPCAAASAPPARRGRGGAAGGRALPCRERGRPHQPLLVGSRDGCRAARRAMGRPRPAADDGSNSSLPAEEAPACRGAMRAAGPEVGVAFHCLGTPRTGDASGPRVRRLRPRAPPAAAEPGARGTRRGPARAPGTATRLA